MADPRGPRSAMRHTACLERPGRRRRTSRRSRPPSRFASSSSFAWDVVPGVEADLLERLEHRRMGRGAGNAACGPCCVPLAGRPAEQALRHHRAALVPDADEQDVQPDLTPLMIAPCMPSATEWVNSDRDVAEPGRLEARLVLPTSRVRRRCSRRSSPAPRAPARSVDSPRRRR